MKTDELLGAANDNLMFVLRRPDLVFEKGQGMLLFDSEGKQYLDFIGGWAVNALGHCHPAMVEALHHQAQTLINASPAFWNRPQIEFAELLVRSSCMDKVFFMSTGAEANEGAIKLARKYGLTRLAGATNIITTQNGFHGRTLMTMAATGKDAWETLYGPKMPGFRKGKFNDLDSIEALSDSTTCAVLLEPVQGEGGVNVATPEFIHGLRELCDRTDMLLIFDEIQTGMGRCGTLFDYQQYGVEPDILTLGKGIGGGFPLSAMLVKDELDIFEPGDQGGTYTGQPLAMATGMAVLEELLRPGFLESVQNTGSYITERLKTLSLEYEISNIRGRGLLLAFDLEQTPGADVARACLADGLILNSPKPHSIRLIPPLIATRADVDRMFEILLPHLRRRQLIA